MTAVDPNVAIADFIAAHAEAWSGGDIDGIAEAMGLPQMIAQGAGTTFIEDDAALVRWIDERLAVWGEGGVASATAAVEAIEALPDEAARVTSRWTLLDAGGDEVRTFIAVDTLACDDGEWYFVVTDLAGEDATWAGVS